MFNGLTLVNTAGWCISKLLRERKKPSGNRDSPATAGDAGDMDLIPGLGRAPGDGNGNPLQYSCLENLLDGGAWWATVHRVAKSRTQLSDFTFTFSDFSIKGFPPKMF